MAVKVLKNRGIFFITSKNGGGLPDGNMLSQKNNSIKYPRQGVTLPPVARQRDEEEQNTRSI